MKRPSAYDEKTGRRWKEKMAIIASENVRMRATATRGIEPIMRPIDNAFWIRSRYISPEPDKMHLTDITLIFI